MHGKLTAILHDAATAQPVAGVRHQVFWVEGASDVLLRTATTNSHGTAGKPLIDSAQFSAGTYRLVLHTGDYFTQQGGPQVGPEATRFFDLLTVTFVVVDASVDVCLKIVISPTGYTVTRV